MRDVIRDIVAVTVCTVLIVIAMLCIWMVVDVCMSHWTLAAIGIVMLVIMVIVWGIEQ